MKKEQRQVFIELASIFEWDLCGFCRYSKNDGDSVCSDSCSWCESPIEAITKKWEYATPAFGEDCWGFSPMLNVTDTADVIGTILSEGYDPEKCQWWKDKDKIYVEGIKPLAIKH